MRASSGAKRTLTGRSPSWPGRAASRTRTPPAAFSPTVSRERASIGARTVRVVFFVQGERVPAARARGFEIARALEQDGLSCSVRVPHPSVYGDTRLPGLLA